MKSIRNSQKITRALSLPAWECGLKYNICDNVKVLDIVTPCVGVWIEIAVPIQNLSEEVVTPCVGVWIEMAEWYRNRGCGFVTPCVGVWIEIARFPAASTRLSVTPCVGVWIEIPYHFARYSTNGSLPAWECGLKFVVFVCLSLLDIVTPCVGVWIEIYKGKAPVRNILSHSLRGSVD